MPKLTISKEVLMTYKNKILMQHRQLTIAEICKVQIAHVLYRNEMQMNLTAKELDIDRKTLWRKLVQISNEIKEQQK